MKNRFKQLREEEHERRKDIDPKLSLTVDELSHEMMEKCSYYINPSKIKKLENDIIGVKIDKDLLLAYKRFFNVCIDWLIDESVSARSFDGDMAIAAKTTHLSEQSINTLNLLYERTTHERPLETLDFLMSNPTEFHTLIRNIELAISDTADLKPCILTNKKGNLEIHDITDTQKLAYRHPDEDFPRYIVWDDTIKAAARQDVTASLIYYQEMYKEQTKKRK